MAKEISITVTEENYEMLDRYFSTLFWDLNSQIVSCNEKLSHFKDKDCAVLYDRTLAYREALITRRTIIEDMRHQLAYTY